MSVRRVNETPRVTKPYTDEQWRRVEALAQQVDADLAEHDVRLTMGGEPTFVGIDEPDSPQWNGDAMGPLKRNRAVTLIRRIRERMAPGALLHFGQGKWYPGEAAAALGAGLLLARGRRAGLGRRRSDCRRKTRITASKSRMRERFMEASDAAAAGERGAHYAGL